jgi:hypothetical protein
MAGAMIWMLPPVACVAAVFTELLPLRSTVSCAVMVILPAFPVPILVDEI